MSWAAGLGAAGKGASVRSKAGWTKKAAGTGFTTATGIAEPVTKVGSFHSNGMPFGVAASNAYQWKEKMSRCMRECLFLH